MRLTKIEQKKKAKESINNMFIEAQAVFNKDSELADRYVKKALNIRNKFKIQLSKEQKNKFCKECHRFLVPGKNCKVRTKNKFLLYHCNSCNYINKQGIGKYSGKD